MCGEKSDLISQSMPFRLLWSTVNVQEFVLPDFCEASLYDQGKEFRPVVKQRILPDL